MILWVVERPLSLQLSSSVLEAGSRPVRRLWRSSTVVASLRALGKSIPSCSHSSHLLILKYRVGLLTMIVPLYQAELAHPDIRGLVTGLQQFMLGIGGVCGSVC